MTVMMIIIFMLLYVRGSRGIMVCSGAMAILFSKRFLPAVEPTRLIAQWVRQDFSDGQLAGSFRSIYRSIKCQRYE
jgi:hypothetical protein